MEAKTIKTKYGSIKTYPEHFNKLYRFNNERFLISYEESILFKLNKDFPEKSLSKFIRDLEKSSENSITSSLLKNDRISLKKPKNIIVQGEIRPGKQYLCDVFVNVVGIGEWENTGGKLYARVGKLIVKEVFNEFEDMEMIE